MASTHVLHVSMNGDQMRAQVEPQPPGTPPGPQPLEPQHFSSNSSCSPLQRSSQVALEAGGAGAGPGGRCACPGVDAASTAASSSSSDGGGGVLS